MDQEAISILENTLMHDTKWVKVHAAEYLIKLGYTDKVFKEFFKENKLHNKEAQYRIGIWRVLFQSDPDKDRKQKWLDNIYRVYSNPNSPDRLHATETLAKLQQPVKTLYPQILANDLKSADKHLCIYALWVSTNQPEDLKQKSNTQFVDMAVNDPDILIRKISCYILRNRNNLTAGQWQKLYDAAVHLPYDDDLYTSLLSTILLTIPENIPDQSPGDTPERLLKNVSSYSIPQRMDVCLWLTEKGDKNDIKILEKFLSESESQPISHAQISDLRISAANAILKINRKNENKK